MGDTKIEWATKSWNVVTGCSKITPGCDHCYSERMHRRLEKIENSGYCDGARHFSIRLHPKRLNEPLKWKKPQRIFVSSMGDLFHKDVPDYYLDAIFDRICAPETAHHKWFILTKRSERMKDYTNREYIATFLRRNRSIVGMVSAENQEEADKRIPDLLASPFATRGVSIEPMLGPVDFARIQATPKESFGGGLMYDLTRNLCFAPGNVKGYPTAGLDWIIVGGETGPKARPLHPDWVRSVRDQCQAAGVPFFFKQWGEWAEVGASGVHLGDICISEDGFIDVADENYVCYANESEGAHLRRVGKKAAGHLLDGKEYREEPS